MNKKSNSDIDWAEIIDLFASEYGWTIEYITALDLGQIVTLMDKIQIRRDKYNGSSEGETPSTSNVGGDSSDTEMPMSYFENQLGGKKIVENGVTKIII